MWYFLASFCGCEGLCFCHSACRSCIYAAAQWGIDCTGRSCDSYCCLPPFAYLLSCAPIVLLVSVHVCVIEALLSPCLFVHIYEILHISSLLLVVRERTAVIVWIEKPLSPHFIQTSFSLHTPTFPEQTNLNHQHVPDGRIDFHNWNWQTGLYNLWTSVPYPILILWCVSFPADGGCFF